jgi:hypothetical protein
MCIQARGNGIPGHYCGQRQNAHGPKETSGCGKLSDAHHGDRCMHLSQANRLLLVLHRRIFSNCMTTPRSHKEGRSMALGCHSGKSVHGSQDTYVQGTGANTTRFQPEVLCPDRCIWIWHGSCTLIGGRIQHNNHGPRTKEKTSPTPHCILLGHIHTNAMKLQCL